MTKNLNPLNIEIGDFVKVPLHPAKGSGYENRIWEVTAISGYGGCIVKLVGGTENNRKAATLATLEVIEKGRR